MKKTKFIAVFIGVASILSSCTNQDNSLSEGTSEEAPASVFSETEKIPETTEFSQTTASESSTEASEFSDLTVSAEDYEESDMLNAESETAASTVSVTETAEKELTVKSETTKTTTIEENEQKTQLESESPNTHKELSLINIPANYSGQWVEDRTDDPEIYELFSGAFFIDNCFYSGIGYDSSGIFENLGDVDGYYGFKHSGIKYSDYEAFLRQYFTDEYAAELSGKEICCKNIDGELCYDSDSHRGGDVYFESAFVSIAEKSNEQIKLNVTASYTGRFAEDYTYNDHTDVKTLIVVKTSAGWRLNGFCSIC